MSNWIKTLAEEAKKENWCVKSWCTTCGCEVFRSNLIKKCFKNNNVPFPSKIKSSKRQNPIIVDLFQDDIEFCVKTISEELATLNNEDINQIDPVLLRKIFQEIYAKIYIKLIKDILGNSSAGKYLISMEEHSKYVDEQYRKHDINNDPKMNEERRKIKKEFKAKMHALRIKKYKLLGKSRKK
jgi:hypothetical protein|tara:strand:- start:294 stop:842 length:549 start_codon:yes stop_codon:yes gene_type:complete